jgi:hypothetical protein
MRHSLPGLKFSERTTASLDFIGYKFIPFVFRKELLAPARARIFPPAGSAERNWASNAVAIVILYNVVVGGMTAALAIHYPLP